MVFVDGKQKDLVFDDCSDQKLILEKNENTDNIVENK